MTTVEDRLRDALGATAALVGEGSAASSAPDASPGWPVPPAGGQRHPRRARRVATAVGAAVVLVLVLIAGLFLAGRSSHDHGTNTLTPAASQGTGSAPYFATDVDRSGISIRSASTGVEIARVPPPSGMPVWDTVSATADPRVFFLAGESHPSLYRLRLTAAGRVSSLKAVGDLQTARDIRYIAATPDGKRVAYTVDSDGPGGRYGPVRIDVVTVATGQHETFTSSDGGLVSSLSWDASGRYLAFAVDGSSKHDTIWVLDTHAGHDLFTASRRLPRTTPLGETISPVLSAGGSQVYVIAAQQAANGDKVTRLIDVDLRTGAQRVLFELPFSGRGGNAVWEFTAFTRDPAGGVLLVADNIGHAYRVDVATTRSQRFPFLGGQPGALAW